MTYEEEESKTIKSCAVKKNDMKDGLSLLINV